MSRVQDGIKALSQRRPTFAASWHTRWAGANLTQRTVSPADARNLKIFHSAGRYECDETLATTDAAARRDAERSGSPRNSVAFINGPTTSGAGVRRRAASSLHHVCRRVNTTISKSRGRSTVCLRLGGVNRTKQTDKV